MKKVCRTCKFWYYEWDAGDDDGQCRRRAAPWIETRFDDWCGEWQERTSTDVEDREVEDYDDPEEPVQTQTC